MSGRRAQSAATLAGLSAIVVLATVSAAVAAGPGGNIASLQVHANALDTRAHRALLDLYAIDTRLETAQAARASLETRAANLRGQQVLLGQELAATRLTLSTSQHHLAANLRMLYEQGDTDTLAVMFGATSLDDAITRLDDLSRVADLSKQVVDVTSAAQIRLARVRSALAVRRVQLNAALVSARRTTRDLAAARSGRLAFIARLRSEQQLKARQISALQLTAQRTAVKSQVLQSAANGAATTAPANPTMPADPTSVNAAPQPAVPPGARTITVSSTGYSLPGHTATGLPVGWGVVAVDPALIPLGTRMTIPGYGEAVAADTGSAVRGATIDLWFPTLAQARAWGRRTLTITLH